MTENGKDYGISIFLIYILIFCNAYLTKKNPTKSRDGAFLFARKQVFKLCRWVFVEYQ